MKQRRKRKRNRKVKSAAIQVVRKKSGGQLSPSDDDSSHSPQEDSEDNGKSEFVTEHLNEPNEADSVNGSSLNILKCSQLQNGSLLVSDLQDPLILGHSEKENVVSGDKSLPLRHLPSGLKDSLAEQSSIDNLPSQVHSPCFVEDGSTILEYDNQSSLKVDHSDTVNSFVLTNMEDKGEDKPAESGVESKHCSLIRKEENITVSHQHRMSKKNEINTWAFFSFDTAEKKTHANLSDSCLPWPEGTSQVICEQRPKKWRRPKQKACSEITVELTDYQMDKKIVKGGHREVLRGNNAMADCAVPSSLREMPCIEMGDFPTESRTEAGIPNNVSKLISPRKTEKCKRIFKLAPNFDFPRQIPITKVEKMLKAVDVSTEQVNISDERTREKDKPNECQEPSGSVVVKLPPNVDVEPILYNDSHQLAEEPIDSSRLAVHSVQTCTGPSKAFLSSEQLIVTCDQIVETNLEETAESTSPDTSAIQPDILCSVKDMTDSAAGKTVEIKQINETEETEYSQIKHEDLYIKPNSLGLPLSTGFALQLVALFGSPGVPLDTLLPDDYIVPLDWAISKEIYLQWKTSVEKKQGNNISKEKILVPADAITLEDSNKNGQEGQESSDMSTQMYLQETSLH